MRVKGMAGEEECHMRILLFLIFLYNTDDKQESYGCPLLLNHIAVLSAIFSI